MVSPWPKSSKHMTHSPLSSDNTSSAMSKYKLCLFHVFYHTELPLKFEKIKAKKLQNIKKKKKL